MDLQKVANKVTQSGSARASTKLSLSYTKSVWQRNGTVINVSIFARVSSSSSSFSGDGRDLPVKRISLSSFKKKKKMKKKLNLFFFFRYLSLHFKRQHTNRPWNTEPSWNARKSSRWRRAMCAGTREYWRKYR